MKHLLKMSDLSTEEIIEILNLADQLKYELKHNIPHPHLKGKTLGMIFQKASTRTRVSFETGMYQLGGYPLFLSSHDLQIGRGEPVQDTARVLSRYLDGIMIRTFEQKEVENLAEFGNIPIINGLTDYAHPCQVLADLMTIREYKNSFDGLKMCFIGDGNNMANSLIVGGLKVGMAVSVACPEGYRPADALLLPTLRLKPAKMLMFLLLMYGHLWVRNLKQKREERLLKAIRLTMKLCPLPSLMLWLCTVCRLIVKKK